MYYSIYRRWFNKYELTEIKSQVLFKKMWTYLLRDSLRASSLVVTRSSWLDSLVFSARKLATCRIKNFMVSFKLKDKVRKAQWKYCISFLSSDPMGMNFKDSPKVAIHDILSWNPAYPRTMYSIYASTLIKMVSLCFLNSTIQYSNYLKSLYHANLTWAWNAAEVAASSAYCSLMALSFSALEAAADCASAVESGNKKWSITNMVMRSVLFPWENWRMNPASPIGK